MRVCFLSVNAGLWMLVLTACSTPNGSKGQGSAAGGLTAGFGASGAASGTANYGGDAGNAGGVSGADTAQGGSAGDSGTVSGGNDGSMSGGSTSGGSMSGGLTGSMPGGSSSGGSSSNAGSAAATPCNLPGPPNPNSGSFAWYYFGNGTTLLNGTFQSTCGYLGTESGMIDTVENIAAPNYFMAIPGSNNFNTSSHCGECVEITNAGRSIIATVIDECPIDQNPVCSTVDFSISWKAWNDLGYLVGNPSGTTWRFVPCPVTGHVSIRFKANSNNQEIYIENGLLPIQGVAANGSIGLRTSYGAWRFDSSLSTGTSLTMTDMANRSISATIANTDADQNQDTGEQFPSCQ